MKFSNEIANGVKTVYGCPPSPLSKFAKVNGVLTALTSQTENTVTFGSAPGAGLNVDVYYGNDIVIPPAAYTATFNGPTMQAPALGQAATLFLNATAVTGTTPSMTCKVQVLDIVSNTWIDVPGAVFAAVTAASVQTLSIFPGAIAVANVSVNTQIRNMYRVVSTITGTTPSFTFSIGAQA